MSTGIRWRPMLMSGPMVRATLEDRKRQTRRVMSEQPNTPATFGVSPIWGYGNKGGSYYINAAFNHGGTRVDKNLPCPYGQVGDRLWVRENWRFLGTDMARHGRNHSVQDGVIEYAADGARRTINTHWENVERWMTRADIPRPSIHMPRWASRISLEITEIRHERLYDLRADDVAREGLSSVSKDGGRTWKYGIPDRDGLPGGVDDGWKWSDWNVSPIEAFARLWNQINAKRGYGWDVNPWLWVVSFRRLSEAEARAAA